MTLLKNYTLGQKVDYYRNKTIKLEREVQILRGAFVDYIKITSKGRELSLERVLALYKEVHCLDVITL